MLVDEHVKAEANHTLDDLGIAKNARQEKFKARDEKIKAEAEKARMMALYKEHVLGEKPGQKERLRSARRDRRHQAGSSGEGRSKRRSIRRLTRASLKGQAGASSKPSFGLGGSKHS